MKTMAGSMRVTTVMAEIAERAHMNRVSANRPTVRPGVMTMGKAVFLVAATRAMPMPAAIEKPMTALSSACHRITL